MIRFDGATPSVVYIRFWALDDHRTTFHNTSLFRWNYNERAAKTLGKRRRYHDFTRPKLESSVSLDLTDAEFEKSCDPYAESSWLDFRGILYRNPLENFVCCNLTWSHESKRHAVHLDIFLLPTDFMLRTLLHGRWCMLLSRWRARVFAAQWTVYSYLVDHFAKGGYIDSFRAETCTDYAVTQATCWRVRGRTENGFDPTVVSMSLNLL